ncbi:hypothetical protein HYS96_03145 [Candidatus Daviesbacteria bacterium]|nr:hypothetical protein [Candidatus Daviesbacteria bacterium]
MSERPAWKREKRPKRIALARQPVGYRGDVSRRPMESNLTPLIPIEQPSRGIGRLMLLTLGLVTLDYFSKRYDMHHIELFSSYGHDFLGPSVWWLLTQGIFSPSRVEFFKSRKNIFLATGLSFAFEGLQYLAEQKTQNVLEIDGNKYVYDPYDFVAYTLGTVAALGLHRMLYGKRSPNKPN